ncbi:SUKH-3 domain-containing protein [Paludisphaera soli]|uniref:SUKH-3 domain-containing protein n=1 Tax=Paludisphaera soli TaxID=2712865 RepID=UPI0013ECCA90
MGRFAGWLLRLRLLRAGWRPRREVWGELRLPTGLEVFPEARRILAQYGGLRFSTVPFEVVILDPCRDQDEVSRIRDASRLLNKRLYRVGYQEVQDRLYLLLDETGWIYTLEGGVGPDEHGNWVVEAAVRIQASSFERALPYLTRGEVDVAQGEADLRAAGITSQAWTVGP